MRTYRMIIENIERLLTSIDANIAKLVGEFSTPQVTGIRVTPGTPAVRPPFHQEPTMATFKVTLTKKSKAKKSAAKGAKLDPAVMNLQDNEDNTYTVQGVDLAGNPVDITDVATLTAGSVDTSVLTVDPPAGMTFTGHGVKPGSTAVSLVAAWNDGSVGPFTMDVPFTVTGSPVGGLVISAGTPVARP